MQIFGRRSQGFMAELSDLVSKYKTVEHVPCTSCGNAWFFDKWNRLTCTTCSHDEIVYEIEEDFSSGLGETGATITAGSEPNLIRGIGAYATRYAGEGYGVRRGEILSPSPGVLSVRMTRYASCD